MKRSVMLILILILISGLSFAQDFWQQTNGPSGGKIYSLGNHYFMGPIFAGTADSGLYRTEDGGVTWIKTALSDTMVTSILVNSIWQIFAGTADSGLFIAENYGDSWTQTDNRLKKCSVRSMAFNPIENTFLGTADSGIFRSPGFGTYWTQISSGQTKYGVGVVVAIVCYSSGHIYAGINTISNQPAVAGYVYHSSDNGDTWPDTVLVGSAISSLAAGPTGIIYAGTRENGVFRSTDYGKTWTPVDAGLTDIHIGPVITNSLEHVFAATDSGVYRSTDFGNHWSRTAGLQGVKVMALTNDIAGYIYAGADDGFMYRTVQSTTQVEKTGKVLPSSFALKQNYPNPFNPTTTIEFDIPSSGFVSLKVYDLAGQEVAVLINKALPAGNYKVEWNPHNISSGLYFYKLETRACQATRKLVYMK
jgi:photosystem II stability/assembly factor-like uncharacterized protein